jgi:dTMP kinase
MKKKSLFITFEGGEGSGKSTQIEKLAVYLSQQNYEVVVTREPGATKIGRQLRQILLESNYEFKSNLAEILLFTVDRLEHLETVVRPALAAGKIVLCDRYLDSTFAYQVGGGKVSREVFTVLAGLVKTKPDLTFLLDLDPRTGLERVRGRGVLNNFDQKELVFHQAVRAKYLELAAQEPTRIKKIEAENFNIEQVFAKILKEVKMSKRIEGCDL